MSSPEAQPNYGSPKKTAQTSGQIHDIALSDGGARTIEQIEERSAQIRQAEVDAMREIAALMRDLAVKLPHESALPVKFAEAAKSIEMMSESAAAATWIAYRSAERVVVEWDRETLENLIACARRALESMKR
jgi:hypothetical protein